MGGARREGLPRKGAAGGVLASKHVGCVPNHSQAMGGPQTKVKLRGCHLAAGICLLVTSFQTKFAIMTIAQVFLVG